VMASISASAYTVGFRSVDLLRNVDVLPRYILIFRVFGSVINSFILSEQIVLINQKWFKLQQLVRAREYLKLYILLLNGLLNSKVVFTLTKTKELANYIYAMYVAVGLFSHAIYNALFLFDFFFYHTAKF
jgi:hypothetical protein